LVDLKKTVQKDFRSAQISMDTESHPTTIPGHRISSSSLEAFSSGEKGNCVIMDEVNFQYLKHVIVKFLTSREVCFFTHFPLNYPQFMRTLLGGSKTSCPSRINFTSTDIRGGKAAA